MDLVTVTLFDILAGIVSDLDIGNTHSGRNRITRRASKEHLGKDRSLSLLVLLMFFFSSNFVAYSLKLVCVQKTLQFGFLHYTRRHYIFTKFPRHSRAVHFKLSFSILDDVKSVVDAQPFNDK